MHRTFSVLRRLGWWSLLVSLTLQIGISAAAAQNPIQTANIAPGSARHGLVELAVGTSQPCRMTTRGDLKRVENPNSAVVRVERIADKNNEILLVAESPGRTLITFVDQRDQVETHEVVVTAAAPAIAFQPPGDGAQDIQAMRIVKGTFRTVRLREVPTGGISNEDSKVVKVTQSKEDLRVATFEALELGRSRVVFVSGNNKERAEIIDVTVIGPESTGPHQVELQVVVAVVNRSLARKMSFSWNVNGPNWFASSLIGGPGGLASVLNPLTPAMTTTTLTGTGNGNIPFGLLNNSNSFLGFLQATRQEGLTKILAEPRLVTLSGRPASIQSGGNVQIVAAGGVSSAQISANFGTIVNFLPIVLPNGKIHLEVAPQISTPTDTIPIPGAGGPGTVSFSVLKRSANVTVQLEDGQTLAIGGLIQNRVDSTTTKVPVLGDMPFFGAAFRSVAYADVEEEMIILVTPRLVDGVDCTKFPRYLPGRETRVPDDFELFLEGISVAPRKPRHVNFHPRQYQGAHMGASNIGLYPCADGTCGQPGCSTCASGASYGSHGSTSIPRVPASMPTISDMPVSNSRTIDSDLPGSYPPIREIPSSLGPATPSIPSFPALPRDSRPVLPSSGR